MCQILQINLTDLIPGKEDGANKSVDIITRLIDRVIAQCYI